MLVGLDTNVLVYAEGVGDAWKVERAQSLSMALNPDDGAIAVQVLAELYRVLVRKAGFAPPEAKTRVLRWSETFHSVPSTRSAFLLAMETAKANQLQIFDALILAVAATCGCRLLASEDMQDGVTFMGVTVANPFAETPHRLLAPYLA